MFTHLHISGHFHPAMAELSNCYRDCMAHKVKNIYYDIKEKYNTNKDLSKIHFLSPYMPEPKHMKDNFSEYRTQVLYMFLISKYCCYSFVSYYLAFYKWLEANLPIAFCHIFSLCIYFLTMMLIEFFSPN